MTAYESKHGVCRCTTDEDGSQRIVLMDEGDDGTPIIRFIFYSAASGCSVRMAVGFEDRNGETASDLQAKAFMNEAAHRNAFIGLEKTLADATEGNDD